MGRYALNIKGLPYTTQWVEYPDIERVCKQIGASPAEKKPDNPSQDHYTLPVIQDPNTGRVVSDSMVAPPGARSTPFTGT